MTVSDKAQLAGAIKLHVHYYENSNVQMVTKHTHDEKDLSTSPEKIDDLCAEAVKVIKEFENGKIFRENIFLFSKKFEIFKKRFLRNITHRSGIVM